MRIPEFVTKNKLLTAGFIILAIITLIAIFAPLIAPYEPGQINVENALNAPNSHNLFGTDEIGRDILSRMIYGTRVSISVSIFAIGIATLIGLFLGCLAGFYGGAIDYFVMRFVDVVLCFPTFFLILAVAAILESSVINIVLIIGLTSWMTTTRLIRAEILSLKEKDFILAAKAIGASNSRIIIKHLLPNAINPILVNATLGMGYAILIESSLSFLGLGVQPPTPSWGNILMEAKPVMGISWWMVLFPGLAILISLLTFNLIAEGLREKR